MTSISNPTARRSVRIISAAAPGTPALQVQITGALLEQAVMRIAPGTGTSEVTVLVAQPDGPAVRAALAYPAGESGQMAAQAKARMLRRGDIVALHGSGLSWRPRLAVLQLDGVSSLQPLVMPPSSAMAAANDVETGATV